jgi:hypothetical protein
MLTALVVGWLAASAGALLGWCLRQAMVRGRLEELERLAERRRQIANAAIAALIVVVSERPPAGGEAKHVAAKLN